MAQPTMFCGDFEDTGTTKYCTPDIVYNQICFVVIMNTLTQPNMVLQINGTTNYVLQWFEYTGTTKPQICSITKPYIYDTTKYGTTLWGAGASAFKQNIHVCVSV